MAKRKYLSGTQRRRLKRTKLKSTADGSSISTILSSVSNEALPSPSDWLTSIQTDHLTCEQNLEKNEESAPLLKLLENGSQTGLKTPEIKMNKLSQNDCETPKESLMCEEDVDKHESTDSMKNGIKTNQFYGSKLQSFTFSFQKSPKVNIDGKRESVKLKQEKKKGKSGNVKRKHKSKKDKEIIDQAVKKTKKDNNLTTKEEYCLDDKCVKINEVSLSYSKDVISNSPEEHHRLGSDITHNNKDHNTVLDVMTPVSSSPMIEEPLFLLRGNEMTDGYNHQHNDMDVKMKEITNNLHVTAAHTKTIIDEVVLELGSLNSEDSVISGLGSVKASSLLKRQNNEYFFTSSSESSPDLHADGPSNFIETPKSSSISSPDIDIGSEDSCTMDINKAGFLFNNKESSESSYSPSCSSSETTCSSGMTHRSPEHQTSITSFFKMSTKQNSTVTSPKLKKQERTKKNRKERKKKMEQMYLDLGQKDFGHVTCGTCGMVYTCAQPDDEIEHIRHHKKFVNGLRFNGWKDEHVVKEFHDGRIIMVKPDDHPSRLKKVEEIRKVVDSELGFAVDLPYRKNESKTFLFIASKRVVGCCVATQIDKGYPVLPSTPSKDSTPDRQIAAWCCSTVPVPAQCGISKIWVWNQYRRKKVATRLLDCARSHFIYGCTIAKEVLAFSDPTPDGKRLATSYVGTQEFLVFR